MDELLTSHKSRTAWLEEHYTATFPVRFRPFAAFLWNELAVIAGFPPLSVTRRQKLRATNVS